MCVSMAFDFRFRYVEDVKDRDNLIDFLRLQSLGYPLYNSWVDRVVAELESGWKSAVLAYSNGVVVGDLVFQPHKQFPKSLLEWKNARVISELRGRGFASFMERQLEVIAGSGGFSAVICDTRRDPEIERMLVSRRYQKLLEVSLYDKNEVDVIYVKPLVGLDHNFFVSVSNSVISRSA